MVEVSAKKKQNLDALLEMILLVTEIGEHKSAGGAHDHVGEFDDADAGIWQRLRCIRHARLL